MVAHTQLRDAILQCHDDHTAIDRWGNEPWRIALLCYAGEKPGYTARYVQWEPPRIIDWDAMARPTIRARLCKSETYLTRKERGAGKDADKGRIDHKAGAW